MRTPKYFQSDSRTDRWLISYVDIVTILLILFVAAAAQAVQRAASPPPVARPANPPPQAAPPSRALLQARQRLEAQGIALRLETRGLVISLPQTVLFHSGQDAISPEAVPLISRIADVIRDMPNKVSLIGHADSTPIHSRRFRNNWDLSAARSLQLLEFLTERYGISEARLSVASQGCNSPKGPNDTEDGRAANRRVDIIILGEEAGEAAQ